MLTKTQTDKPNRLPAYALAAWLFLLLWATTGCAAPAPALAPALAPASAPAPTPQAQTVSDRAWLWLHSQELAQGGFGDSRGEISPNSTSTVLAVLATLPPSDADQIRRDAALTAMQPGAVAWLAGRDSGLLAKAALGVIGAGGDPRQFAGLNLVAELSAVYDAQPGLYHPESFYRHLLAVQALAAAGEAVPDGALAAIGRLQQADGSWSWRIDGAATSGDVDTTAQTLLALAAAGVKADDSRVQAALAYLARTQSTQGGWAMDADSVPNADSTGLALHAFGRLGLTDSAYPAIRAAQAQAWLATLQQPDGSFHYSADLPGTVLLATLDALPAFQWQFAE